MFRSVYTDKILYIIRNVLEIKADEMAEYLDVTKQTIYNVEMSRTNSNTIRLSMSIIYDYLLKTEKLSLDEVLGSKEGLYYSIKYDKLKSH